MTQKATKGLSLSACLGYLVHGAALELELRGPAVHAHVQKHHAVAATTTATAIRLAVQGLHRLLRAHGRYLGERMDGLVRLLIHT